MTLEFWELLSYIVTVIGLPLAIFVFLYEQRREREHEEDEVYQSLADNYQNFLQVAMDNPDLGLFSSEETPELSPSQRERMLILFSMLVSLFERAFLLLYEERMTPAQTRRWRSWDDYMHEWCRRKDFRVALPELLKGEDVGFAKYLEKVVREESSATRSPGTNPIRSDK